MFEFTSYQTKDLLPRTFSQWFDRLLAAPIEGGTNLVKDILLRITLSFPQALALPFRVLVTSFCDWSSVGQSSFEHFIAKLMKDGKGDAASIYSEYVPLKYNLSVVEQKEL